MASGIGIVSIFIVYSMASNGLIQPFLGALQACTSVLLTIGYGVAARECKLIQETSINDISGICVKLFLPALLIVNLGSQLHADSALNYVPILGSLNQCTTFRLPYI